MTSTPSSTPAVPSRRATIGERAAIAFVFVVLAGFFPYFQEIYSANELSRLYLAMAIIEDGSISIDGPIERLGDTFDKAEYEGRAYTDKAPGASILLVPALYIYNFTSAEPVLPESVRLARLFVSTLPTVFLLFGLLGLLREHIRDQRLRIALLIAYGLGTPAMTYGMLLFGHQLSAAVVFWCFLLIRKASPQSGVVRAVVIGALAAAAICVEYQNALFLLPLAGYFLWRVRVRPKAIVFGLVGALPLFILLGMYHKAAFGSPFVTGYNHVASHFSEVHEQGLLGVKTPHLDNLALSFVSSKRGLFYFAPFLALAVPGLLLLPRAKGDGLVSFIMITLYTLFVSSMVYSEGGWTVSQRHLTPMIPWMILPIGLLVQRVSVVRPVFVGTALISIFVTGISSIVWPHFQETLSNPFFQLAWPMFDDGWLPPSIFGFLEISSKTAVLAIGALICGAALVDLVISAPRKWLIPLYMLVAVALFYGYVDQTKDIGADKRVTSERAHAERVYEPDPLAEPVSHADSE